jgi:hypothetical protein
MQTSLQGIAKKAREQKKHRFQDLYRLLNEEFLLDCWRYIRKDAAYGVDRVSAEEYEQNLEENIRQLVERLKRKSYRAKLVRRQYIPKGEGKFRPLGIPIPRSHCTSIQRALGFGYDWAARAAHSVYHRLITLSNEATSACAPVYAAQR